jgi:hypothetical protein
MNLNIVVLVGAVDMWKIYCETDNARIYRGLHLSCLFIYGGEAEYLSPICLGIEKNTLGTKLLSHKPKSLFRGVLKGAPIYGGVRKLKIRTKERVFPSSIGLSTVFHELSTELLLWN